MFHTHRNDGRFLYVWTGFESPSTTTKKKQKVISSADVDIIIILIHSLHNVIVLLRVRHTYIYNIITAVVVYSEKKKIFQTDVTINGRIRNRV